MRPKIERGEEENIETPNETLKPSSVLSAHQPLGLWGLVPDGTFDPRGEQPAAAQVLSLWNRLVTIPSEPIVSDSMALRVWIDIRRMCSQAAAMCVLRRKESGGARLSQSPTAPPVPRCKAQGGIDTKDPCSVVLPCRKLLNQIRH